MKKLQLVWLCLVFLVPRGSDACEEDIIDLHPTQMSVGMIQVQAKELKIAGFKKKAKKLNKYLNKHHIVVVRGPEGKTYMIDHHHLALALYRQGVARVACVVLAKYDHLSMEELWKQMTQNGWVYPNYLGQSYDVSYLPSNILGLKDDPYRSLAGSVQDAGGYGKTKIHFAEFIWADFFRTRIHEPLIQDDFETAVAQGLHIARSQEEACALNLPG